MAMTDVLDVTAVKADFPLLQREVHGKPIVYLDSAATSQKPRVVLDALDTYYETINANVHRGVYQIAEEATAQMEAARANVARFIGAPSTTEIVFTKNATEAINLVAHSWGRTNLQAGDAVLLTHMEHHADIVPWQQLAAERDIEIRWIPLTDDGQLDLTDLDRLLDGVKLLGVTAMSNVLGTITPVRRLTDAAHAAGALALIDACQYVPHVATDVTELGADFLAFSGHKMCGPTGIGVLYGRQEVLASMPPYQGGGEMILNVEYQKSTWKHAPHRFEAGTPDISGAVGLHAAMDYLDRIGRDRIAQHDQELGAYAYERLARFKGGIRLFGPHVGRAGLVSFLLKEVHAHDVVTVADQRGVALRGGHHCNQPLMHKLGVESTARASFYFYNTTDEIDRFVEVLGEIQKFFAA
jgi:cysteine desulfurase/selenocysteine lyase